MSELGEILDSLDFESYLDAVGVEYRLRPGSSGRQINIKTCPSCGDNNWKVYANESTGLGNCFKGSCELGTFNKWKFIRSNLGEPNNGEVIRHIKEVASSLGWRPKRTSVAVEYSGEVVLPQHIDLPDPDGNSLQYLLDRGITNDLAEYFHLSYCHAGGFRIDYGGREIRQDYSGRVLIPIFDLNGVIRTFQGRDITGTREQKYLFPPGLPASGRFLYNAQNAWASEALCIGEGAFDVMAIHSAMQADSGMRHIAAIGTFGMHLSANMDGEDQLGALLELVSNRPRQVTFMWDSEPAALRAAIEAAEKLRGVGIKTRIAILPKGKDPNEVHPSVVRDSYMYAADPSTSEGMRRVMKAILF